MGTFELNDKFERNERTETPEPEITEVAGALDQRRLREECIIALKVYDICRQQECLTPEIIGPARAAENLTMDVDEYIQGGEIITPPEGAAAVSIERLRIKKIIIVDKEPSPFRNGYWDVDVKFVFTYKLVFRCANGDEMISVRANSIYNQRFSLFGSIGQDLVIGTDLFNNNDKAINAEPFVWIEAKAVALAAEIGYRRHKCEANEKRPCDVKVTIGLFSIIKLCRIVNLSVESKGFCIPKECEDVSPIEPCEFFDNLDFPMDVFAPPQKPEFTAGLSLNIAKDKRKKDDGCSDCE